jgi:thiosulfate reductase cytochrome b subunit
VTHWLNALFLALLLMSGLAIFNFHPALYWGNYGYAGMPSVLSISAEPNPSRGMPAGVTRIGNARFDTTGVLGVSTDENGRLARRAFPWWLTLPAQPNLALARDWHFALAWLFVLNGTIYLVAGLFSGHFRRDLAPSAEELRPRSMLRDIWAHLRLRRPRGEAARRYNPLQKLAYLTVIFILLPTMLLSGLTMSPAATAAVPVLLDLFSGRQSARTIHFIAANLLVLFVLVHLFQVLVAGALNGVRSMITGRYMVPPERGSEHAPAGVSGAAPGAMP